jgi:calcineurin-like phosphoesterase family protein
MRLGVVTDVHLAQLPHTTARWHNEFDFAGAGRRLRKSLRLLSACGVDAVVVLGDLTESGDRASLDQSVGILATAGLPTLLVPGNHDCIESTRAMPDAVARAGGGLAMAGPAALSVNGLGVAGVSLATPAAGRGFAAAELPQMAERLVLLSHYPLLSRREAVTAAGYKYAGDLVGRERLAAHVDGRAAVAISGHLHVRDAVSDGPLLQLLLPAMIEPPYACAVVEVGGDPFQASYLAIPVQPTPEGLDVPLFVPESATWVLEDGAWRATG